MGSSPRVSRPVGAYLVDHCASRPLYVSRRITEINRRWTGAVLLSRLPVRQGLRSQTRRCHLEVLSIDHSYGKHPYPGRARQNDAVILAVPRALHSGQQTRLCFHASCFASSRGRDSGGAAIFAPAQESHLLHWILSEAVRGSNLMPAYYCRA